MTNPNPDNQSEPRPKPRLVLLLLSRTSITVVVILLVGLAGGAWWLWSFVQRELGPIVQKSLIQTVNRPIYLGRLERLTPFGLRFGPTFIPATATDPDNVSLKGIDVTFNLLQVIFTRTLNLNVTLDQPNVLIQQDKQGRWVRTTISTKPGPINIQLDRVQLENASVVLLAYPKPGQKRVPFAIAQVNGSAELPAKASQPVSFELVGQPVSGGNFKIQGETNLTVTQAKLQLQGQNLLGANLTRLIKLPLDIVSGRVDGNLGVQLIPHLPQVLVTGTAGVKSVTAKFDRIPQQFINTQGNLVFQGTQVKLDNVSTSFGKIPLLASGSLDTQKDLNLVARVPGVSLANVEDTLLVKVPIAATGIFGADLRVTGPITGPILSGSFANIKLVRVDRVDFKTIRSQLVFTTATSTLALKGLQILPAVGGQITGAGTIGLGAKAGQGFNVQVLNVPGDALARLYQVPAQIRIGSVSANTNTTGTLSNLVTNVSVQLPQATYPTLAKSQIIVAGAKTKTVSFRNTVVNVADGTIRADGTLVNGNWQASATATNLNLGQISGRKTLKAPLSAALNLSGNTNSFKPETISLQGSGKITVGSGTVTASTIQAGGGRFRVIGNLADINPKDIAQLPPNIKTTPLSGSFDLAGSTASFAPKNLELQGKANVNVASGTVTVSNIQAAGGRFNLEGNIADINPGAIAQVPPGLAVPLSGTFKLGGSTASFEPKNLELQGSGSINVAGGTVEASNIQAARGEWRTAGTVNGLRVGQILPQLPRQAQGVLDAGFNLSGSLTALNLNNVKGEARGSIGVAGGTVRATNVQLAAGKVQVEGTASRIEVAQLIPQLPPQFQGTLRDSQFNLSGNLATLSPQSVQGSASANLDVAGGTVRATNVQLAAGKVQVEGTASGIQVARLLPQAPAQFQGTLRDSRFNLSGNLATLSPQTVQGSASANLDVAGGTVTANRIGLTNGRFSGSVTADRINLGPLAGLALASRFGNNKSIPDVQGRLSGSLDLAGSLSALNLAAVSASGQLRLLNLAAGGLTFDPVLGGNVNLTPGQGANLNLAGVNDKISLQLSPTYKPVSFLFQLGAAIATGKTSGDTLRATATNFPISIFKAVAPLPSAIASQSVSGTLDANLALNLNTYVVDGNLAIKRPAFGTFIGDQFTAQFRYADGGATLANGLLTQGPTRYTLNGSVKQTTTGPQFQAALKIAQAQVQTLLTALQLYDVQDFKRGFKPLVYAKANTVDTASVGAPQTLLTQLSLFSQIKAAQQQRLAQQGASPLPPLSDFTGSIDGEISASGSLRTGIAAKFDILGSNWQWGEYEFNPVIARGSLDNGVLTILPFRIESNLGEVAFTGQVGGPQQSGQLRVRNFPIDVVKKFAPNLPVDLTGQLNVTATVAGSQQNPQAIGDINLVGGTVNQKPINSAIASFNYNNARLNFGSTVVVDNTNSPIQATGSIPYALPFAAVKPDSDQISVNVNVQDQAFGLLNLVTDQVAWEGGQGQLQIKAAGTLKRPVVTGSLTINNATIAAAALPKQPLTNVTGTALFTGDRIQVKGIQGDFSKGNVATQGVIPIFAQLSPNDPDQANPLTVALNGLKLNLPGLYQGGASGNVVITGYALGPILGGDVQLAQGQVLLTKVASVAGAGLFSGGGTAGAGAATKQKPGTVSKGASPTSSKTPAVAFNNLKVTLGKNVSVRLPPVVNFKTTGTLTVNGSLSDLRPQGTIQLKGGELNVFTTQFVLARSAKQTVTFSPNQGLDPSLNLRLVAVVPEVTRTSTAVADNTLFGPTGTAQSSDTIVSRSGAFQTVRVQASVTGPASSIFDNLVLTSQPYRSREEIIGLLGGGFVQTLAGNSALGVANFAGSALLGNFQEPISKIGNALGLSELRVFPTVISDTNSRTSTFGLAAEGSIDITGNLSADILRFLTPSNQPTQFGLSYQLTNRVRLRTSTNLSGDNNAQIEFQSRF